MHTYILVIHVTYMETFVVFVETEDEDEGGGSSGFSGSIEIGRGEILRSSHSSQSQSLEDGENVVPEQRVSGGRLFIENGRDFYTKVMKNGVGVIVRGKKKFNEF